jgi:hypothetical protein
MTKVSPLTTKTTFQSRPQVLDRALPQENQQVKSFTAKQGKLIEKIAKTNILFLSFVISTLGDFLYLFVNASENAKKNPQFKFELFCQKLAEVICNFGIYWSIVFALKGMSKNFSQNIVKGFHPKEIANKASEVISDGLALIGGLFVNDLLKPIAVSHLTSWLINYLRSPSAPLWFLNLFNLQTQNPSLITVPIQAFNFGEDKKLTK